MTNCPRTPTTDGNSLDSVPNELVGLTAAIAAMEAEVKRFKEAAREREASTTFRGTPLFAEPMLPKFELFKPAPEVLPSQ